MCAFQTEEEQEFYVAQKIRGPCKYFDMNVPNRYGGKESIAYCGTSDKELRNWFQHVNFCLGGGKAWGVDKCPALAELEKMGIEEVEAMALKAAAKQSCTGHFDLRE